jgi:hypothetical protein
VAHKPGHSGFSYWNGEEDEKPKKKRKRRRKVDVAKAVVKSDKESKERKSKAKVAAAWTKGKHDAAKRKVASARKKVAAQRETMWAPYGKPRGDRLPKSIDTKKQAYQAQQEAKLYVLKRELARATDVAGGSKYVTGRAEKVVEGETQKQARTKKVVKAAKTQASMKAYAKKKKRGK